MLTTLFNTRSNLIQRFHSTALTRVQLWREAQNLILMVVGATIAALGYSIFQVSDNIAAGGVGGISIILGHFTNWPEGRMILLMNIPLVILGYFYLGRWQFVLRTVLGVFIFSITTDVFIAFLPHYLPSYPITNDVLLNAIYAGVISGLGFGLVYRSGSTLGGTGITGRILQQKTGIPLSQVYLYTDGVIIAVAGVVFGWEIALYAFIALFLSGLFSDYVLEGPSIVRTATIITDHPDHVSQAIMAQLNRGVSYWSVTGAYTYQPHSMLMCTVHRSRINDLKRAVANADPAAFLVIGNSHQALGTGFAPLQN